MQMSRAIKFYTAVVFILQTSSWHFCFAQNYANSVVEQKSVENHLHPMMTWRFECVWKNYLVHQTLYTTNWFSGHFGLSHVYMAMALFRMTGMGLMRINCVPKKDFCLLEFNESSKPQRPFINATITKLLFFKQQKNKISKFGWVSNGTFQLKLVSLKF